MEKWGCWGIVINSAQLYVLFLYSYLQTRLSVFIYIYGLERAIVESDLPEGRLLQLTGL